MPNEGFGWGREAMNGPVKKKGTIIVIRVIVIIVIRANVYQALTMFRLCAKY